MALFIRFTENIEKDIKIGKRFMIYIDDINRYSWDKSDFAIDLHLGVFKTNTEYGISLTLFVLMIQFVYKRKGLTSSKTIK